MSTSWPLGVFQLRSAPFLFLPSSHSLSKPFYLSTTIMLLSILKPATPIDPIEAEKTAAREAFKVPMASIHAVAMSRPGDSDALEEEWMAWVQEWKTVAPRLLAAHKWATDAGIKTIMPQTLLQEVNKANKAYKKIMDDTIAGPADP
ncbi:hypothetical protein PAXINDRAFT_6497 [Paxillus involutus ATCC 200175]|nr:hypothetical protein PAXINDRAFT_6497 [Paxillus involutus ATCC 200175]